MLFSKHFYICFFALFIFDSLFSQTENKEYNLSWYSADDYSLPQNSVKSIIEDKSGFIWLSTENGIVRYDGQRFKVYNTQNVDGMTDNRMVFFSNSFFKDTIFIRNDRWDVLAIANRKVSLIPPKKISPLYKSHQLSEDHPEYVNFFFGNNRFYRISKDSVLLLDGKNRIIDWSPAPPKALENIFIVGPDLFTSYDIEYYSRFKDGLTYPWKLETTDPKENKIYCNAAANQSFLRSGKNLYLLENRKGKLSQKLIFNGFENSMNIVSVYYDYTNSILYLGSGSKGLLVVKKKNFRNAQGGSDNGVYYAQVPYGKDNSLVTTGETFNENGSIKKFHFNKDNDKYILFQDSRGDIWTKGHNLLYRFTKKSGFTVFNKWIFEGRITEVIENLDETILITLTNPPSQGKIYFLDPKQQSLTFKFYMPLSFKTSYMIQDEEGIVWAGSNTGFHKVDLNTKKIENIPEISKTYVRSIYINNPDEIWVTTYDSGFYLYKPSAKTVTHFPYDENKFLLSAHCIVEDDNNFFWIPTNKGLFQVSKQSLLDYSDKKIQKIYYHYYDKSSGFATNEFNGGCHPCGVTLRNKNISFPSMSGMVIFDPYKIKPNLPIHDLYFDDAEVDGKRTEVRNDTLYLNQDFERLRLFLTSPYYGNKENLNIEVKLEGKIRQNWTRMDDEIISFSSLPPGEYHLTARKLSGFDSEYYYKNLTLIIPPAFWQTVWFNIALVMIGFLLVFYTIKMRLRYIKRKNKLLEKKIAEQTSQLQNTIVALRKTKENLGREIINHKKLIGTITHDIKSPLRFLALTGKHIYQHPEDTKSLQEGIKSIYTSSFQLYNFVDNLLEYVKVSEEETYSESYSLYVLAEEKIKIFLNIASSQKTTILNKIAPRETVNVNRLLLSIIIHNLLDNAIKNTFSGKITFTSGSFDNRIFLIIEDTGKGMPAHVVEFYNLNKDNRPKNQKKIGMGLQMISELLVILNGEMEIQSSSAGTRITIWFENRVKD